MTMGELYGMLNAALALREEYSMIGNIYTKERCPICGSKFRALTATGKPKGNRYGLVCPDHPEVRPKRYYIELSRKQKKEKIYSDSHGQTLTSWEQAYNTQREIDGLVRSSQYQSWRYKQRTALTETIPCLLERFMEEHEHAPSTERSFRGHILEAADFFADTPVQQVGGLIEDLIRHLKRKHGMIGAKVLGTVSSFARRQQETQGRQETGAGQAGKKPQKWKDATLAHCLADFSVFLGYCSKKLGFPRPAIPRIKIQRSERPEWIDSSDQERITLALADHPIIEYVSTYGHRPCMARALMVGDVDVDRMVIAVNRRRFSADTLVEGPAKNGEIGELPILQEEFPRLAVYILNRVRAAKPEQFLFLNPRTGGPYSEKSIGKLWARARKELSIKRSVRLYDVTRHSVASILMSLGYKTDKIARLLCVSEVMIRRHYGQIDQEIDMEEKRELLRAVAKRKKIHKCTIYNGEK